MAPTIDNPFIKGIKSEHKRLQEIRRLKKEDDEPDGSEVWEPAWQTCTLMMLIIAVGTLAGWAINGLTNNT